MHNWKLPIKWLGFLIVIIVVIGVFFRFANLDKKVYWQDETVTSLRIAGYTEREFLQQVFDGRVIGVEDLQKYQRTNPEKGLIDTIKSLAVEDPQHPPLYYVMTRFWVQWFGNSVSVTRSLSALISLLAFPSIYWLCMELFDSPLVGWMAIALIAVSPFHVLYAQEAREYSLWTVTILLLSASLLRAMRLKTKLSWGIYAASLAIGLYTYPFTGLVAIGHGLYVVATEGFRLSKTVIAYLLAFLAGVLTFAPWLWAIITNPGKLTTESWTSQSWTSEKMALWPLFQTWTGNLSRIFFDVNLDSKAALIYTITPVLIGVIIVASSIYFICSKTSKQVWLFILTLIVITALSLILPDLILGGRRSSVSRYLIPCYLGIQLAVAYLLATKISISSYSGRRIWQVMFLVLISSGVVSCAISSQAEAWWIKKNSHNNPQAARIINQASHPLLISSKYNLNPGELLSLSYLLEPKVRLQLVVEPNIPNIPDGFSEVFLFNPSKILRNKLEKQHNSKIEIVSASQVRLWRLVSNL